MAVQYAYKLDVSAMTDEGSPEGTFLQRYAAIQMYQHRWMKSSFSPHILYPRGGLRYLAQSNDVSVYTVEANSDSQVTLMLHRPGSACSGLPELTSLCEAWTSVVEPMSLPGARYTVDLSEDLLVISRLSDDQTECVRSPPSH
ncbi:hypothetical protein L226DRAFT_144265 [Lentinus tigrinus ALCF2SS1-7]|uniref:uncharacterized protein n=1 Tax=Lentinus tigrinus ALCF2SS1-7 TaxID=1328758 RepID=UPI0011663E53|nr:hypothetical protein L226DRAFT_144265 [Lentinus tigrinus ALCF2SS1-7]